VFVLTKFSNVAPCKILKLCVYEYFANQFVMMKAYCL